MASLVEPGWPPLDCCWWQREPALLAALEGNSLRLDRTIYRLSPDAIEAQRDLRAVVEALDAEAEDLLVYGTCASGHYGSYRLAAVFPGKPDRVRPMVLCLDGPRGTKASEHRFLGAWLCLYYPGDPPERRWKFEDGLLRLFDIARLHVFGEYMWRKSESWPVEEAPHGECTPAAPDPSLSVGSLGPRGRNQPCPCGSGRKAKKCCYP